MSFSKVLIATVSVAAAMSYCYAQKPLASETSSTAPTTAHSSVPPDLRARQAEFLNQVRQYDPHHEVIDRAVFNSSNELGIIVNRSVEMQKIPPLMRTLLTRMAQRFPNQDLTIFAYAPTNPPLKLGTAHLNARTGDIAYLPEHH